MRTPSRELSFWDKLNIYVSLKNHKYNNRVDEALIQFINEGELVYYDSYNAYIKYNDKYYAVWISNFPYAALTACEMCEKESNTFYILAKSHLWCDERPSRKVEIKFFNWFLKESGYVGELENMNCTKNRFQCKENLDAFLKRRI